MDSSSLDYDLKYRPTELGDVVGQPHALAAIRGYKGSFPRVMMFHGPAGTGKTTLARIVFNMMGVGFLDSQEKNCGVVESAIELVRQINQDMTMAPMGGKKRGWILDEVQTFSRNKGAQEALLKILEDGPRHVAFILCTTDPSRVLKAIQSRCDKIELKPVSESDLEKLIRRIAKAEQLTLQDSVVNRIIQQSGGCARIAVKLLQKVSGITDVTEQLNAVGVDTSGDVDPFGLVKALMPFDRLANWKEVAEILKAIKDEEPEGIRMMVLASARTAILRGGSGAQNAFRVIRALQDPLYDRTSGHALLAAACWSVVNAK